MNVNVKFGFGIDCYPAIYNSSKLKVGSFVYVKFDKNNVPIHFFPNFEANTIKCIITWITKDKYVVLQKPRQPDQSLVLKLNNHLKEFIDSDTINKKVIDLTQEVEYISNIGHQKFAGTKTGNIYAVLDRLELCSSLKNVKNTLFTQYEPLVTYLMLTCFDLLGHNEKYIDFKNWLDINIKNNKKHEIESENCFKNALRLYQEYLNMYSMRKSFYSFINSLLPVHARSELLNSFKVNIMSNHPNFETKEITGDRKISYLYDLRNNYTHQAQYIPGSLNFPEDIDKNINIAWHINYQIHTIKNVTTLSVHEWPEIFVKTVKIGLSQYLLKF